MRRIVMGCLVALMACSKATAPAPTVHGTYTLQTVNSVPLPHINFQGGTGNTFYMSETLADVLTLKADGTFTQISTRRITTGNYVSTSNSPSAGLYSNTNGAIALTFSTGGGDGVVTGTVAGNTLTLSYGNGAVLFSYSR